MTKIVALALVIGVLVAGSAIFASHNPRGGSLHCELRVSTWGVACCGPPELTYFHKCKYGAAGRRTGCVRADTHLHHQARHDGEDEDRQHRHSVMCLTVSVRALRHHGHHSSEPRSEPA
jgi:hypothetical protein